MSWSQFYTSLLELHPQVWCQTSMLRTSDCHQISHLMVVQHLPMSRGELWVPELWNRCPDQEILTGVVLQNKCFVDNQVELRVIQCWSK